MFAAAYSMVSKYTVPIVTAWRTADGRSHCSHGSCVLLNADGWILTAAHVLEKATSLQVEVENYRALRSRLDRLRADTDMDWKAKQRETRNIEATLKKPTAVTHQGSLLGQAQLELDPVHYVPGADLAIARFTGSFLPTQAYPIFRNPAHGLPHGTALCKLGFPLYGVSAAWNEAQNRFVIPDGTFPMPLFPLEGIYTREIRVSPPPGEHFPVPVTLIETSSPGIPGHSGGPIFDAQGHVWAIQSHTASYHLGLDVEIPNMRDHSGKPVKAHQFLNVGRGPNVTTITAALRAMGISCQLS